MNQSQPRKKKTLRIREDKIKTLEVDTIESDGRTEEDVVVPTIFPDVTKHGRS